jgi:FkbM family methyltransferase
MRTKENSGVVASVIIPAHDERDAIARQLEALTRQVECPKFEVIVVANRCSDDTIDVSRSFAGQLDLHVLEADDSASAAYARNVGARHASGEYFLFCDADDEVRPEWVSGMVEGLASGRADFVAGSIELDRSRLPTWIYHWRYFDRVKNGIFVNRQPLPIFMTASLGVSRSAFTSVGGFDESFPGAAGEDVHFVRSLFRSGQRLGPAHRAKVLYSPRTRFAPALAQSRAYHRARLANADIEGRGQHPASLLGNMKRALRKIAAIAIRRRYIHPLLVLALLSEGVACWRIDRRWQRRGTSGTISQSFSDYCVPPETPLVGGCALRVPGGKADGFLQTPKGAEMGTHRLIEVLLPIGGRMVDVGANIGSLTIAGALQSGPEGRVFAFEPGLEARTCLIANVERHGVDDRVTDSSQAVGSESAQKVLYTYANSLLSGFAKALDRYRTGEPIRQELVEVVALDDVISERVDLLKIDVEGFEHEVLVGAQRVIEQSSDLAVIFEVNFPVLRNLGRAASDLLGHFPRSDWQLYGIDEEEVDAPLVTLDEEGFHVESLTSSRYLNVLAVRNSRASTVDSLVKH